MGAAGEAGAEAQRRGVDLVDAEQGKPGDRADDIDQGVGGADLVQVDLVDRGAVDLRLGRGEALEDADGALFDGIAEIAVGDAIGDVSELVVLVLAMLVLVMLVLVVFLPLLCFLALLLAVVLLV